MSDVVYVLGKTPEEMERQGMYFRVLRFLGEMNKVCEERSGFSLSDTELEQMALAISDIMCDVMEGRR